MYRSVLLVLFTSLDIWVSDLAMVAGVEQFKRSPDFVIVKVMPQPEIDRDHHIVCRLCGGSQAKQWHRSKCRGTISSKSAKPRRKPPGISGYGQHGARILLQDDGEWW